MSPRYSDPLMRLLLGRLPAPPTRRLSGGVAKYALYKLYDAQDVLLYVGITNNVRRRFKEHARVKSWWSEVADKEVSYFLSDKAEALRREGLAIMMLRPVHNDKHNSARRLDPSWPPTPRYRRDRRERGRGGGAA